MIPIRRTRNTDDVAILIGPFFARIPLNFEGVFAKQLRRARSGPLVSPIRRPINTNDVVMLVGSLLLQESY